MVTSGLNKPLLGLALLVMLLPAGALHAGAAELPSQPTHWEWAGWGGGGFFWCCAYHPTDPNVLYLGGDVAGVYRSDDQGRHWRFINQGLTNYGVYGMAISRSHPDTLYILTLDGICKTTDGGRIWHLLEQTARGKLGIAAKRGGSVRPIAIDPTNPDVVYAGSGAGKLYKTADGGATWQSIPYLQTAAAGPPSVAASTAAFHGTGFLVLTYDSDAADWNKNGRVEKPCAYPAGADWSAYKKMTARVFVPPGATKIEAQLVVQTGDNWLWQQGPFVAGTPGAWTEVSLDLSALKGMEKVRMAYVVVRSPQAPYHGEVFIDAVALHAAADSALGQPGVTLLADWEKPGDTDGWRANRTIKDALYITEARQSADAGPKEKGAIATVAVDPRNSGRVYACSSEYGILRSEDGGATWVRLRTPRSATSVALFSKDPGILYAAFGKEGVQKSTDGGTTWLPAGSGIDPECAITEVAVHPTDPNVVWCVGAKEWKGFFYRSEDGGKSWTGSRLMRRDLAGSPTLPEETGGGAMPPGVADLSRPTNIAVSPANPNLLFLSGNWRNCLSTDGGRTWSERVNGADITCVQDIRFLGTKTYVCAMDEGSFVSEDGGKVWRQLFPLKYDEHLSGHHWRLHVLPKGGTERILATVFPWSGDPNAVLISEDGGKSFAASAAGLPTYIPKANCMWGQGYARALAADPNDPNVLYLGIDGDPEPAQNRAGGGLFRSTDGGRTWRQLPNQPGSRRVFFGLAVDPTASRRIFWAACGAGGGVYRSEDAGETWEHVFRNEAWVFNLAISPAGVIYCGSQNLWRSSDHGKTWRPASKFGSGSAVITGIEIDPRDENRIWISRVTWGESAQGGIYRTTDAGKTWEEITGDIGYRKPLVLRFNPATHELWAGGVGLFKTPQ